tara:strand:- start:134 stop:298 length:165 start_codon:yes stop_codon:yes gene_type:complete
MSGDELMEYIGDFEKEKQRLMAWLEARIRRKRAIRNRSKRRTSSLARFRRIWAS